MFPPTSGYALIKLNLQLFKLGLSFFHGLVQLSEPDLLLDYVLEKVLELALG